MNDTQCMFSRKAPPEKASPPPSIHQTPSKISTIFQPPPIKQSIVLYPEFFFPNPGICITTAYLCGSKEHLTWLGLMLENFLEITITIFAYLFKNFASKILNSSFGQFYWFNGTKIIYMIFTSEGFLEVTIGSWPEWDLNPWPLN